MKDCFDLNLLAHIDGFNFISSEMEDCDNLKAMENFYGDLRIPGDYSLEEIADRIPEDFLFGKHDFDRLVKHIAYGDLIKLLNIYRKRILSKADLSLLIDLSSNNNADIKKLYEITDTISTCLDNSFAYLDEKVDDLSNIYFSKTEISNILSDYYLKSETDEIVNNLSVEMYSNLAENYFTKDEVISADDEIKYQMSELDSTHYTKEESDLQHANIDSKINNLSVTTAVNIKNVKNDLSNNYFNKTEIRSLSSDIHTEIETVADNIEDNLESKYNTLNSKIDSNCNSLNAKIESTKSLLNDRIDSTDNNLNNVNSALTNKINNVDSTLNQKIDNVETSLNAELNRIVTTTIPNVSADLNDKIDAVHSEINSLISDTSAIIETDIENAHKDALLSVDNLKSKVIEQSIALDNRIQELCSNYNLSVETLDGKIDSSVILLNTAIGNVKSDIYRTLQDDYYTANDIDDFFKNYYTSAEINAKLESYYTKNQINSKFEFYYTSDEIDALLNNFYTKTESDEISSKLNDRIANVKIELNNNINSAIESVKNDLETCSADLNGKIDSFKSDVTDQFDEYDTAITSLKEQDIYLKALIDDEGAAREQSDSELEDLIESYQDAVGNKFNSLTVNDTEIEKQFVTAVKQDTGKIEISRRALLSDDIPDIPFSKISDSTGIENIIASKDVSLTALDEATAGYAKTYRLTQGNEQIGLIDIPKDFFLKSAELKVCETDNVPAGMHIGDKYIDFNVNVDDTETEKHIYLNVKELVTEIYSVSDTDEIDMAMSDENIISAVLTQQVKDKLEHGEAIYNALNENSNILSGITKSIANYLSDYYTKSEIDNKISPINEELNSINETLEDYGNEIGTIKDTYATKLDLTNAVSTINSKIDLVELSTDILGDNLDELTEKFNDLENTVSTIDNRLGTAEGNITELQLDVSEINDSIESINTTIENHDSRITNLESNVNTLNTDVEALKSSVGTNTSDITDLKDRLSTAEGNISTNSSNISALGDRLTSAQSDITEIANDLNTHKTDTISHIDQADRNIWNTAATTVSNHVDNADIHVTKEQKDTWSAKVSTDTLAAAISEHDSSEDAHSGLISQISGKADKDHKHCTDDISSGTFSAERLDFDDKTLVNVDGKLSVNYDEKSMHIAPNGTLAASLHSFKVIDNCNLKITGGNGTGGSGSGGGTGTDNYNDLYNKPKLENKAGIKTELKNTVKISDLSIDYEDLVNPPVASDNTLGMIKVGNGLVVNNDILNINICTVNNRSLSGSGNVTLPYATNTVPGTVKVPVSKGIYLGEDGAISAAIGEGLGLDAEGKIYVTGQVTGVTNYDELENLPKLYNKASNKYDKELKGNIRINYNDIESIPNLTVYATNTLLTEISNDLQGQINNKADELDINNLYDDIKNLTPLSNTEYNLESVVTRLDTLLAALKNMCKNDPAPAPAEEEENN